MIRTAARSLLLTSMVWLAAGQQTTGQILHTAVNTALGGGGTAYTTGYESLFVNPANLFIQEKEYGFQISLLHSGGYFSTPLKSSGIHRSGRDYLLQTSGFHPASSPVDRVEPGDMNRFLDRNYRANSLYAEHNTRGEIHWVGMHWSGPDRSYAVALRSRFANRYVTGRSYYDPYPVEIADGFRFDRSLKHQFQSLHELSFGYAESFSFIDGLIPQLSRLIIGIAPKIVISGSYLNTNYLDRYTREIMQPDYERYRSYSHFSTGAFTGMSNRFLAGRAPFEPAADRTELLRPTGAGAGLDLGVTYLITLGDDFSVVRVADPKTRKSLRLSFAITDIGFVSYFENPYSALFDESASEETAGPEISGTVFLGRPGEQLQFLDQGTGHPLPQTDLRDENSFSVLLPSAMHAGLLFQISRIKLTGDVSLGLTDNAFNTTRLTSYIGAEIRPLSFLPLRAGTRFAHNLPDYFSLGAGIETRYFDLNAAVQFRSSTAGPTGEISGISMAALKFYIP